MNPLILPLGAPGIGDLERARLSGIDNHIAIDVRPYRVVISNDGHGSGTIFPVDEIANGFADFGGIVLGKGIVHDELPLPGHDVGPEHQDVLVVQQLLDLLDPSIGSGAIDILEGIRSRAESVLPSGRG